MKKTSIRSYTRQAYEQQKSLEASPTSTRNLITSYELDAIVQGVISQPDGLQLAVTDDGCKFGACSVNLGRREVFYGLTFGFFGITAKGSPSHYFWHQKLTIQHVYFVPRFHTSERYFSYLEVNHHADAAAWDPRSAWMRARFQVREDYTASVARSLAPTNPDDARVIVWFHLDLLGHAIRGFERLLIHNSDAPEHVFHDYLRKYPVLLDLYGTHVSKPRWRYPAGDASCGKAYIEPDFVIRYSNHSYKLVELERPSKKLASMHGEPLADVNQAAYQIAEWRDYISHHYELIKSDFPHITRDCPALLVISNDSANNFPSYAALERYKVKLSAMYNHVDVISYQDLLTRAKEAHAQMAAL
jgi:hypothetical protein